MRVFLKTIITPIIMPMTQKEVEISKDKVEVNIEEESILPSFTLLSVVPMKSKLFLL